MHDINFIRENQKHFEDMMASRKIRPDTEKILQLDNIKRNLKTNIQKLQNDRNKTSKLIGEYKKNNKDSIALEKNVHLLKYSISNSKNNSGKIGWINKNSLSKKIQEALNEIQVGEITKPILVSSGLLVLKLEDKKFIENNSDTNEELKKQIQFEKNSQLNNFSRIYYDKIKKNFLDE